MSYWNWLRDLVSPASVRRGIKTVALDPFLEMYLGIMGVCFSIAFGVYCGIAVAAHYFLLLLGIIPTFLMSTHGRYRMNRWR